VTSGGWTTPAEIRTKVRRRWEDGSLLRAYAARDAFIPIDLPLRGPQAADIAADLIKVQEWAAALRTAEHGGRHFSLETSPVGGRIIGRNMLPSRARLTSFEQAWALLGVADDAQRLDMILETVAGEPAVATWVKANPRKALAVDADWSLILDAYHWLVTNRGSQRYLREITARGVDTKFVERHLGVLAPFLGVPPSLNSFVAALGLLTKPETIRLRFDEGFAGMPHTLSEGAFRVAELAQVRISVRCAVVAENETTFLSLPIPSDGVVIWGKGFDVDRVGALPWLRDAAVYYWGDLDTHGFAILNQLRAWLPQTLSFLMDYTTLDAHRDRWVVETSPTRARLSRLHPNEAHLYEDLVTDRLGDRVRLEQERVDWTWAEERFAFV
jgi:hypothetical protein